MGHGPFSRVDNAAFDLHKFDYQGLITALLVSRKIHSGIWRIGFEFDLRAANVAVPNGQGGTQQVAAAFLPVLGVSLRKVEVLDDLSVDASVANPEPRLVQVVASVN